MIVLDENKLGLKEHKEFRENQDNELFYRNLDMQINTDIDNTLQEYINNNFEKIKSVEVTDNEITKEEFFGDIMDPINIKERDQYMQLMNTFLSRKDKRKLSRYKGFKSFTDRIYGK